MKFNKIASSALQWEPKDRAALTEAHWASLEDPYLSPDEFPTRKPLIWH